jgi:hydroxymethylglutaryl-CoA reductase (NADPH)
MACVAGRNVFVRLVCFAGDAMGMNMVSKGCLAVIEHLKQPFPDLVLIAISGNVCSDKKPAAVKKEKKKKRKKKEKGREGGREQ